MKVVISIPLILVILFSGISVKFATHYCGGDVADTKVSLTGELATCGMESQSGSIPFYNSFSKHCCEDVTSVYSICNNYVPSSFFILAREQQIVSVHKIPSDFQYNQEKVIVTVHPNIRPPGTNFPNSVFLPSLCIFLI